MALEHDTDGCEVNGILFDAGGLPCVCKCCGETWTINATPSSGMDAAAKAGLREAVASNPELTRLLDVDIDLVVRRLERKWDSPAAIRSARLDRGAEYEGCAHAS